MPAYIELRNINKAYQGAPCLEQLNLKIEQKEFFTLLGPSGCGKTTILKIIAGFEDIQSGMLWINGTLQAKPGFLVTPEKRRVGMVFQDFALFPHLTVWQNILFGLRRQVKHSQQIRASEMVELLNLKGLEKQYPYTLSSGEQQRVAIARALAPAPKILLLDEPFSNLDAQLKITLRKEIQQILRDQSITVILVTHDQAEAFSFSDRIAVINHGKNYQTATPKQIYQSPKNSWVAAFVGEANFLKFNTEKAFLQNILAPNEALNTAKRIMLRPEDMQIAHVSNGKSNGVVQQIEFFGDFEYVKVLLEDGQAVRVRLNQNQNFQTKQPVWVSALRYQIFEESS